MADYKELLRRAVEALPENNGAARRAVYEKARAALVGQLRAINPPLAARDITTHRLQLEDCIRQVEQEASEAMIAGMSGNHEASPQQVYFEAPPAQKALPSAAGRPPAKPVLVAREAPKPLPQGGTIEDIIIAANKDIEEQPTAKAKPEPRPGTKAVSKPIPMRLASPKPEGKAPEAEEQDVLPPKPASKPGGRPLPSIVARAEAAKSRSQATVFGVPQEKPYDAPRRGPTLEPRREGPRLEPAARGAQAAVARQPVNEPVFTEKPVAAAMSAVREVDVEPQHVDPQGAIDRAIATLDREARGETAAPPIVNGFDIEMDDEDEAPIARPGGKKGLFAARDRAEPKPGRPAKQSKPARDERPVKSHSNRREAAFAEAGFPRARPEVEHGGMGAITIFLIVFAVLLAGAGGAGYWAVNQGYIDLGTMFGGRATSEAATPAVVTEPVVTDTTVPATGPGNTATPAETPVPATELKAEERLTPEPAPSGATPLALQPTGEAAKSEERLGIAADGEPAATAEAAVAAIDPINIAGSQSLLLEASDDGTTGAVPFSGTVDWSKGTDETGLPTLIGKASIPARNLGVDVLIRKNSDPSLPASHLMEINFRVSDSFIGGSVAGLPGVLLKNEELVQGAPLVGASARVVGNSFLFALSASPADTTANNNLLTSRKWMDLAVIYATGKRAIITLEKDAAAEAMFKEVFGVWAETASGG